MMTLQDLIPALFAKTFEGKLKWEDSGSGSFVASVNDLTVKVEYESTSTRIVYRIRLLNENGDTIERFNPPRGTEPEAHLLELYDLARRKGMKVLGCVDRLQRTWREV